MIAAPSMLSLAQDYLDERRRLGFALTISGAQLLNFARFADRAGHCGPLTVQLMMDWAQGEARRANPANWARRLAILRPFAKHRAQAEPGTEVPCADVFSHKRRRPTPHIYTGAEITELLAAARRLPPAGTLRPLLRASPLLSSRLVSRRSSGSSIQSSVNSVRSSRPSSRSAAATPFCRG